MGKDTYAYRAPRQVEQYGVEAVPASEKRDRWYHLLQVMLSSMLNPAFYILGGMAVAEVGLSLWGAVITTAGAATIAAIAMCATGTIGSDYGLTGPACLEMPRCRGLNLWLLGWWRP